MTEHGMQKIAQALAEKARHETHEKRIEETTKLLSALYDRAAAYTNLIIVAGYAGFFAVWGSVKSDLSKSEMLASAFCLSFSLMVFVFWEILVMLYTSRTLGNLNKTLHSAENLCYFEIEIDTTTYDLTKYDEFIDGFVSRLRNDI